MLNSNFIIAELAKLFKSHIVLYNPLL